MRGQSRASPMGVFIQESAAYGLSDCRDLDRFDSGHGTSEKLFDILFTAEIYTYK